MLVCLPFCISLSRRTGLLSPAATSANFAFACLLFAFVIKWTNFDLWSLPVGGIAFRLTATEGAYIAAAHIYTFFILLTYCSAWGIRQRKAPEAGEAPSKIAARIQKMARRARGFHSLFAPALFTGCALHFLFALLPNLQNFYFTDRSNILIGPILLVSTILCYYSSKMARKSYFVFYLICFFYSFGIMLGSYSRIIPLIFLVLALCVSIDSSIKKPWLRVSGATVLGILTVFFMIYSLLGRTYRDDGLNYALVWKTLQQSADPANAYILTTALTNVFHGVLLLAECMDTTGAAYSSSYQWLSLSPFPSFIDGWDQVLDEQIRINIYTPFSTFAEAYFFSLVPQVALIAIYFGCTRTMTRFHANHSGWRRIFITSFSLLCWAIMSQYPVRNILRIFLLATVLCAVLRVRRPKTAPRRGSAPPFAPRGPIAVQTGRVGGPRLNAPPR